LPAGDVPFQGPILPLNTQVWIDFFLSQCGYNFGDLADIESYPNLNCGSKGIDDSEFPNVAGLTNLAGKLTFWSNQLTNIDSLSSLKSVGLYIVLVGNQLTNVDGLWGLETVGTDLRLDNNNLSNVDGLSSLISVGRHLNLEDNKLENINGLKDLVHVGGAIDLRSNLNLIDISGLNSIGAVIDIVYFDDREYTTKISSTSYLCQAGNEAKISGTIKTNVC
jgi:hypothetical protein